MGFVKKKNYYRGHLKRRKRKKKKKIKLYAYCKNMNRESDFALESYFVDFFLATQTKLFEK